MATAAANPPYSRAYTVRDIEIQTPYRSHTAQRAPSWNPQSHKIRILQCIAHYAQMGACDGCQSRPGPENGLQVVLWPYQPKYLPHRVLDKAQPTIHPVQWKLLRTFNSL